MKNLTHLFLKTVLSILFVVPLSAQMRRSMPDAYKGAIVNSLRNKKLSIGVTMTEGAILGSIQLIESRSPLGVTVVNNTIVVTSSDGNGNNYFDTYQFDGTHLQSVKQSTTSSYGFRDLAFDGTYILGSDDNTIKKIEPTTFAVVSFITNDGNSPHRGLAFDPLENVIYSTNFRNGPLLKIDASNGNTLKTYDKPEYAPYGIAFDAYSNSSLASLWFSVPSNYGTFWLTRVDTAMGKVNYIIDLTDQLSDSCLSGGLEIINNHPSFPNKIVALAVEQHTNQLLFVDLTNAEYNLPIQLEEVGQFGGFDNAGYITYGMVQYDNYLYATNDGNLAIYQIDTDPAHPSLLKTINANNANKIFLHKNLLFISNGGTQIESTTKLSIYSLTDPLNPELKSSIGTGGYVIDVDFYRNYIFAIQRNSKHLIGIDVSDVSNPTISASCELTLPGIAIASDTVRQFLFVSCWNNGSASAIEMIDLSKLPDMESVYLEHLSNMTIDDILILGNNQLAGLKNFLTLPNSLLYLYDYSADTLSFQNSYQLSSKSKGYHMEKINSTIVVSFPDYGIKTFYLDKANDVLLEGSGISQEEPGDFVTYAVPATLQKFLKNFRNYMQGFNQDYYLYVLNGYSYDKVFYGSEKSSVIRLKAHPQQPKATLYMSVKPAVAQTAGCTTVPSPGPHQYDLKTEPITVALLAKDKQEKGWYFKEWTGDVTGTSTNVSIDMNGDKEVTANFIELSLLVSGSQPRRVVCPDSVIKGNPFFMMPVRLTATDGDDWKVTKINLQASGTGNEVEDIKKVYLKLGGTDLFTGTFSSDNQLLPATLTPPVTVPAGETVTLNLYYEFGFDPAQYAKDSTSTFAVKTAGVTATPVHYPQGLIQGSAREDSLTIARVLNVTHHYGFAKIQDAVSSGNTQNGDTIVVCPGTYEECVDVNKSLTIRSRDGRETTIVKPTADCPVFRVRKDSTTIQGFTITNYGDIWTGVGAGVYIHGSTLSNCKVINNKISEGGYGIRLYRATNCSIYGNIITHTQTGVYLDSSSSNTVGGLSLDKRNIISGNVIGVEIEGPSDNNRILGNYIGTDETGTQKQSNDKGIVLEMGMAFGSENYRGPQSNTIQSNVISGNTKCGIEIAGIGAKKNTITKNRIGTDKTGARNLANKNGIIIRFKARENIIGGMSREDGNTIWGSNSISYTEESGTIIIRGSGTTNNFILRNDILYSDRNGIFIKDHADSNFVHGNTISGSFSGGIDIESSNYNQITGNFIGIRAGTQSVFRLPNWWGIKISEGSKKNEIGGRKPGMRNVISGNRGCGIFIDGKGTDGNRIIGNYIGTDTTGTDTLSNGQVGIFITARPKSTRIEGNVISGNREEGIFIYETSTTLVQNNLIGTDKNAAKKLPNQSAGISIENGKKTIVRENTIAGNGKQGVLIYGRDEKRASYNRVVSNYIGTNRKWVNLGNGGYGVEVYPKARINSITNNRIWYNKGGVNDLGYATLIQNNWIEHNSGSTGIHLNGGEAEITGNFVTQDESDGIYCENGANPAIFNNNISDNNGFGLNNTDPSVTVNAQANWWGSDAGPGSSINGNVDASNWCTSPVALVVVAGADTVFAPAGISDSVRCYVQNWIDFNDGVNVTLSDSLGWLTGPTDLNVTLQDSMGADTTIYFVVPTNAAVETENKVRIVAVSQTDPSVTDCDSFLVMVYQQILTRIDVYPDTAIINPGETHQFEVIGYDSLNSPMAITVQWSGTGGTIDSTGLYTAGNDTGYYQVIAEDLVSHLKDSSVVHITIPTEVVEIESPRLPTEFDLKQNYPNPFNPITTIKYSLPFESKVKMEIFNVLGHRVEILVDGIEPAGYNEIRWNASRFPSGIYLIRFTAVPIKSRGKPYFSVKKITLLK